LHSNSAVAVWTWAGVVVVEDEEGAVSPALRRCLLSSS
jgi:hypothetical protein